MENGANTEQTALPQGDFFVTMSTSADEVTISVAGGLDLGSVEELDRTIQDAEGSDAARIVVDLRELSFIDSAGLSVLLAARRRSNDGRLSFLASRHDAVARLVALTGTREALGFRSD
jgi:anti-sigma B factor antagonist